MPSPTYPTRSVWLGPEFRGPATRVISVVPSLTEAVFTLGAQAALVGRTEFCVRPRGKVEVIETIGGTKNLAVARIRELQPDIILANKEENRRKPIEDLAGDIPVLLTDPMGPDDVPALWRELGTILGHVDDAEKRARAVHERLAAMRESAGDFRPRFVYLVWKDPWMVAGHDTYISNLLRAAGLVNALPDEHRRFPALDATDLAAIECDITIYSSEPYTFELPRDLLPGSSVAKQLSATDYRLIDGALAFNEDAEPLSWYPSLTLEGLDAAEAMVRRFRAYAEA